MIKEARFFLFFVIVCFCLANVYAFVNVSEKAIERSYQVGDIIRGDITMKIGNEKAQGAFSTNFGENITLLRWLEASAFREGRDFNCSTQNCSIIYRTEAPVQSFEFDGDEVLGLAVQGDGIQELLEVVLDFQLTTTESCQTPLSVDFLAQDERILTSNSYKDVSCSSNNYGCFNEANASLSSLVIEDFELCQSILMPPAPAYRIGARVTNSTRGVGTLVMRLVTEDGLSFSCDLPELSSQEGFVDCVVEIGFAQTTNASVCISNIDYFVGGSNYKIRSEKSGEVCGSFGRDFEIFARPLQYSQDSIEINASLFNRVFGDSLEEYLFNYLREQYLVNNNGEVICNPECVIPFRLQGVPQTIQIPRAGLFYRDQGFTIDAIEDGRAYHVGQQEPRIDTSALEFSLEKAGFHAKNISSFFALSFEGAQLLRENITVAENFDFGISPMIVPLGISTEFRALTNFSIVSSSWKFGNEQIESSGTKISYLASDLGNLTFTVELRRVDGVIGKKTFTVVVGRPAESVNLTLKNYRARLENIEKTIQDAPPWMQKSISDELELEELRAALNNFERRFANSTRDEQYAGIMTDLLALSLPKEVLIQNEGILPLAVGFDAINSKYLEELWGEEIENTKESEDLVTAWASQHYDAQTHVFTYSSFSDEKQDVLSRRFVLLLKPIQTGEGYVIMDYPFENVLFKQNYGQKSLGEGAGISIYLSGNEEKTIEFAIKGDVEFSDLGIYVAPLSSIVETSKPICALGDKSCEEPFPLRFFLIGLGIIFIVFVILYLVVQEWYKRYYEKRLFPHPDALYNLINFIYNSRAAGLSDNEIREALRKKHWTGERITYAFRKIDGKRTGLWEIPLFKGFERRKVEREIARRQGRLL